MTGRPGPSVQDLLQREHRPVPVALRHEHQEPLRDIDEVAPERHAPADPPVHGRMSAAGRSVRQLHRMLSQYIDDDQER